VQQRGAVGFALAALGERSRLAAVLEALFALEE
jgi:hypothetical protein